MSTTLGGIRELPAYSEYTRFGPSFRQSPGSLSGSRISTGSTSRSKGCWCSYLWIILLLILIIISLIASNLSIYFLMKDSCEANLAKFEREMVEEKKFDEMVNPFNGRKGFDLGSYFTTPFSAPSSSSSTLRQNTNAGKVSAKDYSTTTSVSTTRLTQSQIKTSATSATITTTSTIQTSVVAQTKPSSTKRAGDTGAAVAGILNLEATIRIPSQEQEAPFPSSLNPLIEEYFDLSKYFSLRPQVQNDTRNRRTLGTEASKEIKPGSTNSAALIGDQSSTYNNDHDYLSDTVIDENFPRLTQFPVSSQNVIDRRPSTNPVAEAVDLDPKMAQWFYPFRPLSENSRTIDNSTLSKTVISFQKSPNLSTSEAKLADSTLESESETIETSQNTDVILPSKGYEKSDLFNQFENAVIADDEKHPALFVSSFNQSVAYIEEVTKLPDNLIPTSYIIEWRPHLEPGPTQFSFDGFVLVDFYCNNDTKEIMLNVKDLLIDKRSLAVIEKNNFTNTFPIESVRINDYKSLISFTLIKPLRAGYNYSFGSRFSGNMAYNSGGLTYLEYLDKDGTKRYLAATQFEVAEARRAFPCFDEPRFKANFTITIIRNKNMTSLSNMKLVQSVARSDDFVEDHYATSVKMSTYLVAFVVSDFQFKESQSKRGVSVRTYSRPDYLYETDHALTTAVKLLDYFEEYFDILYALDKLELVALPDFFHGAMENWGLITFKETTMLFDPKLSMTNQRETVSMIVGHELAHQWFGNLVTMRWWNDLWLNEGFAHYMGYASAEAIYPEEPMEHVYILSNVLDALKLDSMTSTHPVLFDVLHPLEIVQFFDTITYKKGSCLVRMMANFLGADTLRKGLQIYLRDNAYKNTISNDLWTALDQAVKFNPDKNRMEGLSVNTVMDNWIRLTGHPVVTIKRSYSSSSAIATQQRMRQNLDIKVNADDDAQLWVVPFTFVTSENLDWDSPNFIWLQNKTTTIENLPSDLGWIVGNVNFQGFYRVNYDETNWKLLFEQLKLNHLVFPDAQRAQILADSFDFSSSGLLDITMALNATEYLINETEYLPMLVALKNFQYIDIIMQTTKDYDLFKEFMRNQLNSLYEKLGWEQKSTDNKHTIYLRYAVLDYSCHYDNPKCLEKTTFLLQSWMERGTLDKISSDLKPIVKCYGVAQGGTEEVKFVIKELRDLKAAMCNKDKVTLENILSFGLNDSLIRISYLPDLVRAASQTYVGREAARSFIVKNWRSLAKTLNEVAGDFAYVFQLSSDVEDRIQLLSLLAAEDVNVAWRKLEEAKEALNSNMRWKEKYLEKIVFWLKNRPR